MKSFLWQEILKPVSRRAGTGVAGALLALGATQPLVDQVEMLVPALIAFTADLFLSYRERN